VIPAGARCGLHGDVAAVDLCKRCGRFLCGECVQLVGEDAYCADCVGKLDGPPSRLASATLFLGIADLVCLAGGFVVGEVEALTVPLSVAAASAGVVELVRIARRRSSRQGRTRTVAGLAIGIVVALLQAAFIIAYYSWRSAAR
jgi:hypothetical protein